MGTFEIKIMQCQFDIRIISCVCLLQEDCVHQYKGKSCITVSLSMIHNISREYLLRVVNLVTLSCQMVIKNDYVVLKRMAPTVPYPDKYIEVTFKGSQLGCF